jgi:hypothetical protein
VAEAAADGAARRRTRLLLAAGAALGLGTALWGALGEPGLGRPAGDAVATVGGVEISRADYQRALGALAADKRTPLRMPPLHGALDRLIDAVEAELGGRLPLLSREDKQRAVRLLDERGAFILRRAVEDVADAMGVSRITVYNYLNAIHR